VKVYADRERRLKVDGVQGSEFLEPTVAVLTSGIPRFYVRRMEERSPRVFPLAF
jgi:hypothetical protein